MSAAIDYSNDPLYREAPASLEAEQSLLGAVLVNNDAYSAVADFLTADHFYEPLHRDVFAAVVGMIEEGKIASPATLNMTGRLPKTMVGQMTVWQYLAQLAAETPSVINAADFGRAIYDCALRRSLITIGTETVNEAYDAPLDMDPRIQIEAFEEKLAALRRVGSVEDAGCDLADAMDGVLTRLTSPRAAEHASIPVPLPEIADVLCEDGLTPGNLYGLLGASGEGKTSLTLQFVSTACEAGHPVLLLSYDQTREQAIKQVWSQLVGVSLGQMNRAGSNGRADLADGDLRLIMDARDRMRGWNFSIKRCSNMKVGGLTAYATRWAREARRKAERAGREWRSPLIILDHVSAVTPEDHRADPGTIASKVNRACKSAAEEIGAAWLSLNQRNGKGSARWVPRPIAPDLYGGEASRQDYDAILYLYRPERWRREALKVAKDQKEADDINRRFMMRKSWDGEATDPEGKAEIGAIKVRYGSDDRQEFVVFEGRFTR